MSFFIHFDEIFYLMISVIWLEIFDEFIHYLKSSKIESILIFSATLKQGSLVEKFIAVDEILPL